MRKLGEGSCNQEVPPTESLCRSTLMYLMYRRSSVCCVNLFRVLETFIYMYAAAIFGDMTQEAGSQPLRARATFVSSRISASHSGPRLLLRGSIPSRLSLPSACCDSCRPPTTLVPGSVKLLTHQHRFTCKPYSFSLPQASRDIRVGT